MDNYLDEELEFLPDRIVVKSDKTQVMMSWEEPLMRAMAEIVAMRRGDVLEIGFGMGISSSAVARLNPRSQTIIEAHPQIIARAQKWASGREKSQILSGKWQDILPTLGSYDGILFDVFGGKGQREAFFAALRKHLRPGGWATLWLADDREIRPELAQVLRAQGFSWNYRKVVAIPPPDCTYSQSNLFFIPAIH